MRARYRKIRRIRFYKRAGRGPRLYKEGQTSKENRRQGQRLLWIPLTPGRRWLEMRSINRLPDFQLKGGQAQILLAENGGDDVTGEMSRLWKGSQRAGAYMPSMRQADSGATQAG